MGLLESRPLKEGEKMEDSELIKRIQDEIAEIENQKARLLELFNPKNGRKIMIHGLIRLLDEVEKGLEFVQKVIENSESIQHRDASKLVISE